MVGNLLVENVTKYYKKFKAVDQASLEVKQGEFFTILGPSGSGKTTLLKMIAGFEEISSGSIKLAGEQITTKKPYERNIGMVFQNYALFPHMTVADNIAYPLRRRKLKKSEVNKKVKEVLDIVHLGQYSNHFPSQLSGGQQQRVALARAIVFSPPLLLLDEPLSALDKNLRQQMQIEIKSIQQRLGITTISVTHDQEEALTMSDKICVMNNGRVEQIDTPENIYKNPRNRFVAEFIGEINLIQGDLVSTNASLAKVKLFGEKVISVNCGEKEMTNTSVFVALRPENIQLETRENQFINSIEAKVVSAIYLGEATLVKLDTEKGVTLTAKIPSVLSSTISINKKFRFGWNPSDASILPDEALSVARDNLAKASV